MPNRTLVALLVVGLMSPGVNLRAQGRRLDLERAAEVAVKAALAAEANSQRPAARGENPYMLPGLILLGGGGFLAVLAFVAPSGVKCEEGRGSLDFECGTTANKGLLFGGLGVAGVGAALLVIGEGKRGSPTIAPRPGGFVVRQQIRF